MAPKLFIIGLEEALLPGALDKEASTRDLENKHGVSTHQLHPLYQLPKFEVLGKIISLPKSMNHC